MVSEPPRKGQSRSGQVLGQDMPAKRPVGYCIGTDGNLDQSIIRIMHQHVLNESCLPLFKHDHE